MPETVGPDGVRALLRELLALLAGPEIGMRLPDGSELLLDADVDGVRCLLIRPASGPSDLLHALSPRELEIARMVARGYPNKTIAIVLDISAWTVGTHIRRIFAKLGVSSRAAMVARLVEENALSEGHGPARPPAPAPARTLSEPA